MTDMPEGYKRANKRVYKYDSVEDIVDNDRVFIKWLLKPKEKKKDKKEEEEKKGEKDKKDEEEKKGKKDKKKDGSRRNKKHTMRMFIHYLHERGMTDATPLTLAAHALTYTKKEKMKWDDAVTVEDHVRLLLEDDDEIGDHEQLLLDFKVHLEGKVNEGKLKGSTARSTFNRLLNFYKFNNVDVSNIDTKINAPTSSKSKKAPDVKLLREAFRKASIRNKCIISCGVTSGMARLDISTLSVGEFEDGLQTLKDSNDESILDSAGNVAEVCILERDREKNYNAYHTFLAPETVRLIKEYIRERNNPHQDPEKYETRRIYKKSDKLFITERIEAKFRKSIVRDEHGKVIDYDDSLRAVTPEAITKMYVKLRVKMELHSVDGEYSTIRSHAMRHYFSNNYKGIDADYKEHWMGHAGDTVKVTYEDYNPEEGLEYYLKGLDGITIDEVVNYIDITDPSVEKMKLQHEEEVAEINERLKRLETHRQYNTAMNLLRGEEGSYIDENGETVTYTIGDDNNAAMKVLRKLVNLMDGDDNFDPSNVSEEELDALMED